MTDLADSESNIISQLDEIKDAIKRLADDNNNIHRRLGALCWSSSQGALRPSSLRSKDAPVPIDMTPPPVSSNTGFRKLHGRNSNG